MDNRLKIINYLGKQRTKKFTMHALSKLVSIPYASFYRTIQKMQDLLVVKSIGKSKVISLKTKNSVVKSYLVIASDEERKEFLRKNPLVKKIAAELQTKDIVVLFGSYAKGKQTEKSDIDLLVINKKGEKSLSFAKFELLFRKKVNPIFVTEREFKEMLKEKEENVGKQAVKNHVVLNNPERFWELVLYGV